MQDEVLHQHMEGTIEVARYIQGQLPKVREVANMLINALKNGNKMLICGNGGSAVESQHFAAELVGHYRTDHTPLPAMALTPDGGILTAIANDYDFNTVFSRQVAAFGKPGDVLVGFSTSGNSANVLAALQKAREIGVITLGFAGHNGGKMTDLCDYEIFFPFKDTARIQEGHLMLLHLLSEYIDEAFVEESGDGHGY